MPIDPPPIQQVFVLIYAKKGSKNDPIPRPIPIVFDSLSKLHQHVVDLVVKNISQFEERHRVPLLRYAGDKMFKNFFDLWRYLKKEDLCRASFDAYWDETPQVVL